MTLFDTIRQQVIQRDGYKCSICFKELKEPLSQRVQHLIPKRLGGLDSVNNCSLMCYKCHGLTELHKPYEFRYAIGFFNKIISRVVTMGKNRMIIEVPKEYLDENETVIR
jgi:hypothetical protein